ncbi:MAG TPA: CHASE domain-containing protein, partial [Spongiibacteraceae bacterium]|nr:CHASE domain-containing protein [Spongiibacteraceae bacterium]
MSNLNSRYFGLRCAISVLVDGLLVTVAATLEVQQINENIIHDALKRHADKQTERVVNRIALYQYGLRGIRGAIVTAGNNLNREVVMQYNSVRNVDEEFPGARGFGFIRRVPRAADADFIAAARADGWPDFTIHQLASHDGERFVIQYIEPVSRNREAIGFDIASESNRRSAAIAAMRSGEVQLTGPITLVQASNKIHSSFLILLPIYRDLTANTEAEREATCIGWSYAPLVIDEIINSLQISDDQLLLTLSDVSDATPVPFYDNAAQSKTRTSYRHSEQKTVFGRHWQLTFTPTPTFIHDLHLIQPHNVFWLGTLL